MDLACSQRVAKYLKSRIQQNEVEEFWVMALNSKCELIEAQMLFKGTVDQVFVHPRDIFRFGLAHNASYLIVGHNHPSGDCQPSKPDIDITKRLVSLGKLMQIPVLDHVIVSGKNEQFFSWRH